MPLYYYEVTLYDDEGRVISGETVEAADPNCALDIAYDLFLNNEADTCAGLIGVEDIALSTVRLLEKK